MHIMSYYSHRSPTRRPKLRLKLLLPAVFLVILGVYVFIATHTPEAPAIQEIQSESTILIPRYDMSSVTMSTTGQAAVAVIEEAMNIHSSGDQLWPMASITKVITALAILQKAPITPGEQGDTIILNQQDEDYYWDYAALLGTLTPVTAGLEMTQYEALQTMLLASSNNMTDTLVDRYFADREEYLSFANNLLARYGLEHTRVADTTGFSPDSVSTPTEMIKLGKIALDNPIIADIVAQPSASPRVSGLIPNYNSLINEPGVTGIKPGLTDESGHNLLFSVESTNKDGDPVTIVAVVMGFFDSQQFRTTSHTILQESQEIAATQ